VHGGRGQRAADAKPVKMAFYMDGQLLDSMDVETKPSKLVYFSPFSDGEMRASLEAAEAGR